MIFKNPAILYGLFLLLIPIIVHLFQLRRFTKVPFTNVAFLKPLITQTRKSRKLKKWLTLLTRLAAIACLVIAFAQPFIPGSTKATQEKQTAIYLDNSYSMQASGANGPLFKTAVTDLLEKLPANQKLTLFTNDKVYLNSTKQDLANELLRSNYSSQTLSYEQIQLKANALLNSKNKRKELIIISDFQKLASSFPDTIKGLQRELVFLEPQNIINIAIDSAFISKRESNSIDIKVNVSSKEFIDNPVTLSLENNGLLVSKTSVNLQSGSDSAVFNYDSKESVNGRIYIEDNGLEFDNELFISNNQDSKIKVLIVNETDGDFLNRIYRDVEFETTAVRSKDLNFNLIKEQNLIVLNELKNISTNLAIELNNFLSNGGSLVLIPSLEQSGYESINGISSTDNISEVEKRITEINFNHPLLKGVFNKRVTNFQYPKVNATVNEIAALNPILKYEDGNSFLYQKSNVYLFTAPLNNQNSNFKNSPLIVPVLYNIGKSSLPVPQLYYTTGKSNTVAITTTMEPDQILELNNNNSSIIPQQRAFNDLVLLDINDELKDPGNYQVKKGEEVITSLSFNTSRTENEESYFTAADLGGNVHYSIEDLIYKLQQEEGILSLWKYFVLGVLFFLLCELLILKFLK